MNRCFAFLMRGTACLAAASLTAADRYAGLETAKYLRVLKTEVTLPGERNFTEGLAVDAADGTNGRVTRTDLKSGELTALRSLGRTDRRACAARRLLEIPALKGSRPNAPVHLRQADPGRHSYRHHRLSSRAGLGQLRGVQS
jgi:hypothetical protein